MVTRRTRGNDQEGFGRRSSGMRSDRSASSRPSGPTYRKPRASSWDEPTSARHARPTASGSGRGAGSARPSGVPAPRPSNTGSIGGRPQSQYGSRDARISRDAQDVRLAASGSSRPSAGRHGAPRHGRPALQAPRKGLRNNRRANTAQSFGEQQLSTNMWSKGAPGGSNVNSRPNSGSTNPVGIIFGAIAGFFGMIFSGIGSLFGGMGKNPIVRIVGVFLAAFLLIGAIDTAVCWGKIYNGVHIDDIDLSGMSVEDATVLINDEFSQRLNSSKITICRNEKTYNRIIAGKKVTNYDANQYMSVDEVNKKQLFWTTDATSLQASINAEAMAYECLEVGRSDGGFFKRLGAQLFQCHVPASAEVNDAAIERLAKDIDKTIGDPRVNYGVKVTNGKAKITKGHDGNMVSRSWLKEQVNASLLGADSTHAFIAEVQYAPLQITEEQAKACRDLINSKISKGATFKFEGDSWSATKVRLGKWTKVKMIETSAEDTPEDRKTYDLQPYINETKAKHSLLLRLKPAFDDNKAHIEFESSKKGNITVIPNTTGTMPVLSTAIQVLDEQLFHSDDASKPQIEVEGTAIPESMSFDEALDYGIIEEISSFTTEYTTDAKNRNTNIHLAADLLNNSIIKANGGKWSFHETAGECNAEKGFLGAGVIVNGETVDEIGGGICQVATTAFNSVYEAGYPIVTRWNHSLYIASYPDGRDAAVSWPDLDLVWKNDTKNDIVMRTSWTKSSVTISLYGIDPGYQVETKTGEFKNFKKFKKIIQKDPKMLKGTEEVKQNGTDGCSITVKRIVRDSKGKKLRTDVFNSKYDPRDEIIVRGTKKA